MNTKKLSGVHVADFDKTGIVEKLFEGKTKYPVELPLRNE